MNRRSAPRFEGANFDHICAVEPLSEHGKNGGAACRRFGDGELAWSGEVRASRGELAFYSKKSCLGVTHIANCAIQTAKVMKPSAFVSRISARFFAPEGAGDYAPQLQGVSSLQAEVQFQLLKQ